ncbi:DUF423 domain-containing protein [Balamuthia mandrillaris]
MSRSPWLVLGGLVGASGVAAGAYGSHGLVKHVSDKSRLKNWRLGVEYQLIHSAPMVACAFLAPPFSHVAGLLFLGGVTMFSGGLCYTALTEDRRFIKLAPVGGSCYIAGWLVLALAKKRL